MSELICYKQNTLAAYIFITAYKRQQGNAIQANMNVKEIAHFDPKIRLGCTYRISDFMCEPTNPYQQTLENKTSLKFGKITKFDEITAPQIPYHYFRFVAYNQLQFRLPKGDGSGKIEYPVLTGDILDLKIFSNLPKYQNANAYLIADYIGCLRSAGKVKRKPNSDQSQTVYRKIDIENLKCVSF